MKSSFYKKSKKVVISSILFSFALLTASELKAALPDTGTCCGPKVGCTCVIGSYVRENAYYKKEGPCP
jgi:hypothetical protein